MRGWVVVGALSGVVALAGCGGDDGDDAVATTNAPTTTPAQTTPAQPAVPAPAGPDLVARGLTIDEVPEGFGDDPAPPDPATLPQCVRDGLAVFQTAQEKHELHFRYTETGPYISETLGRFDGTTAAADMLAAYRGCPGATEQPHPGLGDESHQLSVDSGAMRYDLALLRVGNLVSAIVYHGAPDFDDSEQAVLYRLASDKLR